MCWGNATSRATRRRARSESGCSDVADGRNAVQPWQNDNSTEWAEIDGTPEGQRRLALEEADPAYAIPLKAYIIDCLTRAQAVGMGPYWDKADQGARHSLERFLS